MISIKVRIRWPKQGGAGDLDSTLRVSGGGGGGGGGGDEINRNRRRRTGERILIRFRAESLGLQKEERKVGDDRLQFLNSLVDTTMHTIFQRNKEHDTRFSLRGHPSRRIITTIHLFF